MNSWLHSGAIADVKYCMFMDVTDLGLNFISRSYKYFLRMRNIRMAQGNHKKLLNKKIRKGDRGYPMATVAFYGPNQESASKVVCAIISYTGGDPAPMQKWFSLSDLRKSDKVMGEILLFIAENNVKTVSMIKQIIGCPHEEGVDYPEGEYCDECRYWRNRDRFTGEMLH